MIHTIVVLCTLLSACLGHVHFDFVEFGLYKILGTVWENLNDHLSCWGGPGGYWRFTNETIIDNIYLYTPCPIHYGIKNPCAWILDFESLKFKWDPNYDVNNNCKSISSDSYGDQQVTNGSMSDRTNVNRLHSNAHVTKMTEFDANTMCFLFTGNKSVPSTQLQSVLLETANERPLLHGNILFVGDSIHELFAISLRNLLLQGMKQSCPSRGSEYTCDDQVRVDFIRNDIVSLVTQEKVTINTTDQRYEYPWIHLLNNTQIKYSLLVLNRGAHYDEDNILLGQLNETLNYVKTNFPHIAIVWRNTPQGDHAWKSHFFSEPLTEPLVLAKNTLYFYDLFEAQNIVIRDWLKHHHHQVLYLDVATSHNLRLDAHFDSIHSCIPGPIDEWSKMLYNAMKYVHTNSLQT